MAYEIRIDKNASKKIRKLDPVIQKQIKSWLKNNIENSDNPRRLGKALTGKYKGLWRYRVGNYRVIVDIRDEMLVVVVVEAGKRGEIYRHLIN